MTLTILSTILGLLGSAAGVLGLQLPELLGPYPVGTVGFELIDDSRQDPLAPSPQQRELVVSVFYPTSQSAAHSGEYHLARYMSPRTVTAFPQYLGTSEGATEILTRSYLGAPLFNGTKEDDANGAFPVLMFSHGLNSSRLLHTAQLEQLASRGWIVVAIDHTYDAGAVEFPDGRVVPWRSTNLDNFPNELAGLIEVRVADVEFVAHALGDTATQLSSSRKMPSLLGPAPFRLERVGIFGHSLGGATAAQVLANDNPRFVCGANFDGGIFGPVAQTGFDDKPFVQIEAAGHNRTTEPTWPEFWNHLGGFRRVFAVDGALHSAFGDLPVLRDLLGDEFPSSERGQLGTIAGERLLDIDTAFMHAFFTFCLKGGRRMGWIAWLKVFSPRLRFHGTLQDLLNTCSVGVLRQRSWSNYVRKSSRFW
ncbi:hypothetical protein PG996_005194 [Apiospora saccharicola]|uniref:1-alkyl-2-acetylglycerophosphocholine esterase n=1 Tax=Apiospora saccharicola TaxID=335842 RepID=A0ABR1VKS3_9PEZI